MKPMRLAKISGLKYCEFPESAVRYGLYQRHAYQPLRTERQLPSGTFTCIAGPDPPVP